MKKNKYDSMKKVKTSTFEKRFICGKRLWYAFFIIDVLRLIYFTWLFGWSWENSCPLETGIVWLLHIILGLAIYNFASIILSMIEFYIIILRKGMEQQIEVDKIIDALMDKDKE